MNGVGLLILLAGIGVGTAVAQQAPAAKSPAPAARVGDEVITIEEVEQGVKAQLAKLEEQLYEILDQRLDQLIGERLLAQEAKRRNVSVEELLKTEVFAKAPEVPDSEVTAFINQNRARMPKMDEKELRLKVWDHLRSQKVNEQRQSYVQGLRGQSKVTVLLEEPTSARYEVSGDRGFARGPKNAPVTIVEFSDFQCPFCKTANATVKQVLDKYPGKVRLVFRDYPLASLHPQAPKAHEAARCAGDQQKFWEYHDMLFERSPKMSPPDLKQYAQDLKLDAAAFEEGIAVAYAWSDRSGTTEHSCSGSSSGAVGPGRRPSICPRRSIASDGSSPCRATRPWINANTALHRMAFPLPEYSQELQPPS
jgi:protein-disulfide isomerase